MDASVYAGEISQCVPIDILAMGCQDEMCDFKPLRMKRRPVGEFDVHIQMKYCGVCHTDVHVAAGHGGAMMPPKYPCVPGHELAGVCVAVGAKVTRVKVGDHVGVGCMVDSCQDCGACRRGEEQMCAKQVGTYCDVDKNGRAETFPKGGHTLGGYSTASVVHEKFCIVIPPDYPLECAGPVMCAGVTMYDPLRRQKAEAGTRVGIVGLGGLGQMGVKLAKALGCEVTVISRGTKKKAFATECGAGSFIDSTDPSAMAARTGSLDLILNTVPAKHDYMPYVKLVASGGKHVTLGLHAGLPAGFLMHMVTCGKSKVTGSGIGGIACTQEVIDLCAKHDIRPKIEVRPVSDLNEIFNSLSGADGKQNDTGVRYVLDIAGSLSEDAQVFDKCNAPPPKIAEYQTDLKPCSILCHCCFLCCCCKWC